MADIQFFERIVVALEKCDVCEILHAFQRVNGTDLVQLYFRDRRDLRRAEFQIAVGIKVLHIIPERGVRKIYTGDRYVADGMNGGYRNLQKPCAHGQDQQNREYTFHGKHLLAFSETGIPCGSAGIK